MVRGNERQLVWVWLPNTIEIISVTMLTRVYYQNFFFKKATSARQNERRNSHRKDEDAMTRFVIIMKSTSLKTC